MAASALSVAASEVAAALLFPSRERDVGFFFTFSSALLFISLGSIGADNASAPAPKHSIASISLDKLIFLFIYDLFVTVKTYLELILRETGLEIFKLSTRRRKNVLIF